MTNLSRAVDVHRGTVRYLAKIIFLHSCVVADWAWQ